MGSPPAQQWPAWPAGQQGFPILDIEVEKSIDDLFLLLHGGHNDFRVRCLPVKGHRLPLSGTLTPRFFPAFAGQPDRNM